MRGFTGAGCGVVGGCVVVGDGLVMFVGVFLSAAPGFKSAADGVVPDV